MSTFIHFPRYFKTYQLPLWPRLPPPEATAFVQPPCSHESHSRDTDCCARQLLQTRVAHQHQTSLSKIAHTCMHRWYMHLRRRTFNAARYPVGSRPVRRAWRRIRGRTTVPTTALQHAVQSAARHSCHSSPCRVAVIVTSLAPLSSHPHRLRCRNGTDL